MTWIIEHSFSTEKVAQILGATVAELHEAILVGTLKQSCYFANSLRIVPNYHTFCDAVYFACCPIAVPPREEFVETVLDLLANLDEQGDEAYFLAVANVNANFLFEELSEILDLRGYSDAERSSSEIECLKSISRTWIGLYPQFAKIMKYESGA